jgi:uncharacterized protein (DUF1501 family)
VFVIGDQVAGGQYGKIPSLTNLRDDNLVYTTDYRRIYTTMIKSWMGYANAADVLRGEFDPLPLFKA